MKLSKYFEKTQGHGVIAAGDSEGKMAIAVYAKPHFINEKTVAFLMADRLIHKNLESNSHCAYLFMESSNGQAGKRLYLTKTKEEKDNELIDKMLRKGVCPVDEGYIKGKGYLVYFKIDKVLPLVGVKGGKQFSSPTTVA
jgi:hypothetical protein